MYSNVGFHSYTDEHKYSIFVIQSKKLTTHIYKKEDCIKDKKAWIL